MDRESMLYQAVIPICEKLERDGMYRGNSHHLAQNLAAATEKALVGHALEAIKRAAREGQIEIGNAAEIARQSNPSVERTASVTVFDHEDAAGMVIAWSERGTGFGEITIAGDKHSGEWRVDTETMSPEHCAAIFRVLEEWTRR